MRGNIIERSRDIAFTSMRTVLARYGLTGRHARCKAAEVVNALAAEGPQRVLQFGRNRRRLRLARRRLRQAGIIAEGGRR